MEYYKWIKRTIDIIGFPFTLANIYSEKSRKINEIGQMIKLKDKTIHVIYTGEKDAEYTVIFDAGLHTQFRPRIS